MFLFLNKLVEFHLKRREERERNHKRMSNYGQMDQVRFISDIISFGQPKEGDRKEKWYIDRNSKALAL